VTLLQRVDDVQRRHRWMGLPLAVLWKFLDDEGTYLAALITYYGFVSLFPLLLLAVTVLGFVLQGDPAAQQAVLNSALRNFPVVGDQIGANVHSLHGSVGGPRRWRPDQYLRRPRRHPGRAERAEPDVGGAQGGAARAPRGLRPRGPLGRGARRRCPRRHRGVRARACLPDHAARMRQDLVCG